MTGRWMTRGVVASMIVALCILGSASSAIAASSSDAADAADAIADSLPSRLKSNERACIVKQLEASPDVASQVVASGGLDTVDGTTGGAVIGMVANCAPRLLVQAITDGKAFKGVDIPKAELQCFAKGFGSLDTDVLAAAAAGKELTDLPTENQDQVVSLMFGCMPTGLGRLMYTKIVPKGSAQPSDKQAKCLGQGFGDVVGDAGGVAVLSGDDAPPELVGSMLDLMAKCSPDALVTLFTKSFRQSGASPKVAACVAKGIVKDPDLLGTIVAAQAGDGTMPPELQQLISSCS